MKKSALLIFIISIGILNGCNNGKTTQANSGGYTLQGTVRNIDSGWAYMQHDDSTGLIDDSAKIKNHAFTFQGKVADPTLYHLWVGKDAFFYGHSGRKYINNGSFVFFLEDTSIQVTIGDTINKAMVSGSHANDVYLAFQKTMAPYNQREHVLDSCYTKADADNNKAIVDSLYKLSDQLTADADAAIASYAENNSGSVMSAWAVTSHMLYEPNVVLLKKVYASFAPSVQQSSYGRKIKKAIDIADIVSVGQQAPDFTQADTAGKLVSLSSFKGKYVLVDFWASWCPDCRRENPSVVRLYNKYKDKNFTIIGISLDSKRTSWINAIHDENLTWTQLSDLKLWNNALAALYGVKSIPANFLIAPDGKIIGHNLMGAELDKALEKAL